ncbi:tyrosine protein kinase receptor torso isoform 2-T2 [Cochliomyia hominivorax]
MLLLYYTHSILFYLGLPTFQSNDFTKKLQSFDYEYLPQEVCVAQCLEHRKIIMTFDDLELQQNDWDYRNQQPLKICLDQCTSTNATRQWQESNHSAPKQIHENYGLNLICRDDTTLNFNIDLYTPNKSQTTNETKTFENNSATTSSSLFSLNTLATQSTTIAINAEDGEGDSNGKELNAEEKYKTVFVIKIHLANDADKFFAYLSDDKFFTIDKLAANTTYNISVLAVHSNNKYSVIAQQQQFQTLRRSYTPGNVTEIKITHFTEDKVNKMHLTATMTWKPAADMTCHYDIICFSPESEDYDVQPLEIRNPRQLYKHQLENLTFSSVYKVGIRASNIKNMRESELFWKTFSVPSCVEWHNYNFNICAPEPIQNLFIEQDFVDQHVYSLNVSWQLPTHLPENYTLRIQDLSIQGEKKIYELSKDIHNFFIPRISLYGVFYEVTLTAFSKGGQTTASFTDINKTIVHLPEKNSFVKLIAVILAPIFCVVILSLTIFIIYNRRAKLKRYQNRCKYFEELEKKAPIDPKNTFDFTTNWKPKSNCDFPNHLEAQDHMLYDDDMEIDRNDLILYQVLGEGAFGLVKLGVYKDHKLGTTQEVAVKMLKDHPSADDIYAFRREIEVMKSVEKHPNIVGIIGHCTRFSNEMMLVTEYCSFGNLLNFLRDEWHFVHELQIKRQRLNANIAYIDLNRTDTSSTADCSSMAQRSRYSINSFNDSLDADDTKLNKLLEDQRIINDDNENIIKRFKSKYNDLIKDNETFDETINFQRVEDLNATTTTTSTTTPENIKHFLTGAQENKSYGYHSFCTNSCKCDVDVIIRNMDNSEGHQQKEELDRMLKQQHQQQFHSSTDATIQIKNCNCQMKHLQRNDKNHKLNSAIENKTYFSIFTSTQSQTLKSSEENPKYQLTKSCKTLLHESPDVDDMEVGHLSRVPLSQGDLLNIARQVAVGMKFLAKNKVVHRDLAARNVLVAPDRTVKIADFGLSRDVYQENMYKKTGNGKLPIKWLALESMTHQVYTTQSDVWSYGILLYEIITLGATPYPSISTNRLLHLLKSGYRMEKPKGCSQEFYDLMFSCWNAEPVARPTFSDIVQKLDEMLNFLDKSIESPIIYSEVEKESSAKEESIQNICSDESYLKPL